MKLSRLQLLLAFVERLRAPAKDILGLGEGAVAPRDPLRPDRRLGPQELALELRQLPFALDEATLLDAHTVALLGEEPLALGQLGLPLSQRAHSLLELRGSGRHLRPAGLEVGENPVEGGVELLLYRPELLETAPALSQLGLGRVELAALGLELGSARGQCGPALVELCGALGEVALEGAPQLRGDSSFGHAAPPSSAGRPLA